MNLDANRERLRENLHRVEASIVAAAQLAGRQRSEIQLIAVTKYVDTAATEMLYSLECHHIGESRPQSLWEKGASPNLRNAAWHLIGNLQRNKIKRTLPYIHMLHAGNSLKLLQSLSEEAVLQQLTVKVLLEVNISGDATKHGFAPHELSAALPAIAELSHLKVCGLMTMAALFGGIERARHDFSQLRELRDICQKNCPENISLHELSMGMSNDYAEAIQEGATMIRVGSALWEGIAEYHA